jgi:cell division protein FtsN
VAAELARARVGDPAYVEALYWRGRLATSGDSAVQDFRRVAIEYSTSRWADQALLQLTQLALAAGKPAEALEDARRIRSDYPQSTVRSRAAMWAGRAAFEAGDPVAACASLDSAKQEAAGDIELVNQIAYYRSRCPAALAAAPPTGPAVPARADTPAARADTARGGARAGGVVPPTAPASRPQQFEVQVTATRSSRSAHAMLERVKRAGLNGRIVAGADGYQRVRAGPFSTRRDAEAAAERLRRTVGGHPLVVPAP